MSLLRQRVLLPLAPAGAPSATRRLRAAAAAPDRACLVGLLYFWLCLGGLGLLLFPELRGSDPLIGWRPFWLLLWPATSLALLVLCGRRRR